jgi:hypothetical protein
MIRLDDRYYKYVYFIRNQRFAVAISAMRNPDDFKYWSIINRRNRLTQSTLKGDFRTQSERILI